MQVSHDAVLAEEAGIFLVSSGLQLVQLLLLNIAIQGELLFLPSLLRKTKLLRRL